MANIDLDMAQFHEIFFEESSEGIESMEQGLLDMNTGELDPEVVNTVFRAAHSIKGAAATFGFKLIADFTHSVESILDEVRDRKREVTQELIDLLLKSVDHLRYLLSCSKDGQEIDLTKNEELLKSLHNIPQDKDLGPSHRWEIEFIPNKDILKSGNDPFRYIRELGNYGDLEINVDVSKLPVLEDLDPETTYLSWMIYAGDSVSKQEIEDIFEWIQDDCILNISLQGERRRLVDRRVSEREAEEKVTTGELTSIRVNIDKVDNLINLVGEMVITQSMLNQYTNDSANLNLEKLRDVVKVFEANTRELQDQAMRIRMLPIDFTFQRLPRIVHDISRNLGKKIDLNISGNTTEVDKTVLEKITDPLTHLIRNAIDHGIETAEQRIQVNKPKTGKIDIKAYQEGGKIIIDISDDGAGLNLEKILQKAREKGLLRDGEELSENQIQNLIFQPGFSTASMVTDLSGRGVGMDVVKRNISDLGGSVEVYSESGKGSTFTIKLPLTLAIIDGQLVRIGKQVMIIPMLNIIESVQPESKSISMLAGKKEVYHFRDEYIPVIRLSETFFINSDVDNQHEILILVDGGHKRVGIMVDEVLGQQQVVIKSLETNYHLIKGLSGATVLGDGTVAMIIDISGLIDLQSTESVPNSENVH